MIWILIGAVDSECDNLLTPSKFFRVVRKKNGFDNWKYESTYSLSWVHKTKSCQFLLLRCFRRHFWRIKKISHTHSVYYYYLSVADETKWERKDNFMQNINTQHVHIYCKKQRQADGGAMFVHKTKPNKTQTIHELDFECDVSRTSK